METLISCLALILGGIGDGKNKTGKLSGERRVWIHVSDRYYSRLVSHPAVFLAVVRALPQKG